MMNHIRTALLGGAVALGMAMPASAATVAFDPLDVTELNALTPMDNPVADAVSGTVFQNVVGSISGVRRSPWQGSLNDSIGQYTSVSGGASATYDFDGLQTAFSLIWGSPDNYNNLIIKLVSGDVVVDTINGVAVQGPVAIGAVFVEVTDVLFDRLVFTSGSNAFEFANLTATPIPLPAGGVLLLTALGGLVIARRRKQV